MTKEPTPSVSSPNGEEGGEDWPLLGEGSGISLSSPCEPASEEGLVSGVLVKGYGGPDLVD